MFPDSFDFIRKASRDLPSAAERLEQTDRSLEPHEPNLRQLPINISLYLHVDYFILKVKITIDSGTVLK